MKITINKTENCYLVAVEGMLDTSSSEEFKEKVLTLAGQEGFGIRMDMSGLNYISSQGIRNILTLLKKMDSAECELVFSGIKPAVMEIFELSGLTALMVISD